MCSRTIGEYNLLKPIGKGAFSDVFLAEHKPTQTYAAVKQISKDSSLVIEHLDQLKYEISIMKKCQHPYISKFYEVLEDDVNMSKISCTSLSLIINGTPESQPTPWIDCNSCWKTQFPNI